MHYLFSKVQKCLDMKSINVEEWISGLSLEQVSKFNNIIERNNKTGKMEVFLKPYLAFKPEIAAVQDLTNCYN